MEKNVKIASVVVLIGLVAIVGWVACDSYLKDQPCIKCIEYDGTYLHYEKETTECVTIDVRYYFDTGCYHGQIFRLTGGPDAEVYVDGQYAGKVAAENYGKDFNDGSYLQEKKIHYDLEKLGIYLSTSPDWFMYEGKEYPLHKIKLKVDATVPDSWQKWMVDGCKVTTKA